MLCNRPPEFCLCNSYFYSENIVVYDDKEAEGKYLTLDQLGSVLRSLSELLPGIYCSYLKLDIFYMSKIYACTP